MNIQHKYKSASLAPKEFKVGDIVVFTNDTCEIIEKIQELAEITTFLLWNFGSAEYVVESISNIDDSVVVIRLDQEELS